ncbi:MAG: type II toxin-antitoxin system prevent-host-death family antitoxin [Anaerolineales bacterium]|nr:type II toxin-antitoxin system prevent-host-death family antitoxin [Anaerolineales bacterium]
MQITNSSKAKASLSKLVEQVLHGEEVIIGKAGKPVAKTSVMPTGLTQSRSVRGISLMD